MKPRSTPCWFWTLLLLSGLAAHASGALEAGTNTVALPANLPEVGASLMRVFGALALVIALFLGGVWLFRNWQRLTLRRGVAPRLNVLEVRSLGGRHALYVVGYEQERFLLAASPTGVNLLSHLPTADAIEPASETAPAAPSFTEALTHVLRGQR
jgi:flagellar biogenesis protein FliO